MKTEFKDVAHLYLGCDMGTVEDGVVYSLAPIQLSVETMECRPILRRLKSMSEEEKTEYNKMKQRKGYMAQIHAENTLWLLSKHFDLFGLIESGQAISSPTLNKG